MAFARIEPVVSECRIFYEDDPGPDATYIGSLLIRYRALEPGTDNPDVWITELAPLVGRL